MKAMMRGLQRATSTISLRGNTTSTPTQKVFVGSSEKSKSAESEEDSDSGVAATRASTPPAREAEPAPRQPRGPTDAWARAGSSQGTSEGSVPAEPAQVSEPVPKQAPKPILKKVTLEDSDLEDEPTVEAPKPKPVAFREDVISGYNARAQDRERWLAAISQDQVGTEDVAPLAAAPTTVQATTRTNRAPMEWEQKPLSQDIPGAVGFDQTVVPLKELRRAKANQRQGDDHQEPQSGLQSGLQSPPAAGGRGGFVQLRDSEEVLNEQLKKFNLHMKAAMQKDADPWSQESSNRITWTYSVH